jgi:hypothetical protein
LEPSFERFTNAVGRFGRGLAWFGKVSAPGRAVATGIQAATLEQHLAYRNWAPTFVVYTQSSNWGPYFQNHWKNDRLGNNVLGFWNWVLYTSPSHAEIIKLFPPGTPHDPNAIDGPAGYGAARFIGGGDLAYTIEYENALTATASAHVVTVTEQLDPDLDWTSFQLGNFGFGNTFVPVADDRQTFQARVTVSDTLLVDVAAEFDPATGIATWAMTSIDPAIHDIPTDPFGGFLPPDKAPPQGSGYVSYHVRAKPGLTTGTTVNAQATVYFDSEAPIDTPVWTNTLDAVPPTSEVTDVGGGPPNITVSWAGTDDPGGSGIASYDVYVMVDDGPRALWLLATSAVTGTYPAEAGHRYGFFSLATDNASNRQPAPAQAQAFGGTRTVYLPGVLITTAVDAVRPPPCDTPAPTPGAPASIVITGTHLVFVPAAPSYYITC